MSQPVTGRCFCGQVSFHADHAPVAVRACWCRDCQYLSAGNASVNAVFNTEGFTCTGELGEYVSLSDSGNRMRRRFCRNCGTPLFSESASRPHLIVVRAGALNDFGMGQPTSVIWSASAPAWGWGLADLPRCDGQPGPLPAR